MSIIIKSDLCSRYNDNQRAQDAMNLTFYHWGLHAWIVYVIVGLLLAFLCYRKDLPMTMRTCFYPLLGDKILGLAGDAIDILSVVATMLGVCTSLGLGVIQLNAGLKRINSDIDESLRNQIIIIWGVTALATASVISGVKVGIRRLSEICCSVGEYEPSCQHHTSIMPASHQHHTTIMPPSCQHHASIMPASCQHHASIMPASCQHHASIMPASRQHHASIMPVSCQHHASIMPA